MKNKNRIKEYLEKISSLMNLADKTIILTPFDCTKISKEDFILAGFVERMNIDGYDYQIFYDNKVVGKNISSMNFIIHELSHVQQYEEKILDKVDNSYKWRGDIVSKDLDYFSLPYEIDARKRARVFRRKFKKELKEIKGFSRFGIFLRKIFKK